MEFKCQKLSKEEVLAILMKAENGFNPPLSKNIPYILDDYAKKLSEFARFILCVEEKEIIGFMAFYLNQEGGFAYISLIWVSDNHQKKGIGATMMELLSKEVSTCVKSIRLEVRKNNEKAMRFYKSSGFLSIEDSDKKILLEKTI